MDLDNIKKTWQEKEIKPVVNEEKIKKMLDNKGKGAFEALLHLDKIFLWLLLPCLLIGIWGSLYIHPLPGIFYSILVIIGFFWQWYKIRFLKSINLSEIGILEASKNILKYKKYINYEMLVGIIIIVIFFFTYVYYGLPAMYPTLYAVEDASLILFILLIFGIALTVVLSYIIYKQTYIKNISKIEESIKEIKYFEEDNL